MSRFGLTFRTAATAAIVAAGVSSADAQTGGSAPATEPQPAPIVSAPATESPKADANALFHPGLGQYTVPGVCPPSPCGPATPGMPIPAYQSPTSPGTPSPAFQTPVTDPGLGADLGGSSALPNLFAGADAGPSAGLGAYIDNAVPVSQFRVRYDSAWGNNRPDRAEFFYAKCGCFGTPAGGNQQDAHGPPLPETNVDYQELTSYLEVALSRRLSLFADVPVRFINPDQNANARGWGDLSFGGKYAFIYGPTRVLSLQALVTVPTGREQLGLGSGVTWLEPGLLYQEQLTDRWQVFGQLKDLIPLTRPSDFTGNVLTYGLGSSYIIARGCWGYVAPVGEVVGWTVLSGKELDPQRGAAVSAVGDTIVNAKFGVRIGLGAPRLGQPFPTRSDLYIGYGRAMTGEVWYKDMLRLEYRMSF